MLLVGVVASGCFVTADDEAGGPESTPASAVHAPPLQDFAVIDDAWIDLDGSGYFANSPYSATAAPWSLELTYWNSLVWEAAGRAVPLDAAHLSRWLDPAVRGTDQNSGLPEMAQLYYAVRIALAAQVEESAPLLKTALATLDDLRVGDGYTTTLGSKKPDWPATAFAVDVLDRLGSSAPPRVTRWVAAKLRTVAQQNVSAGWAVSVGEPLVRAAVSTHAERGAIERLASQVAAAVLAEEPSVIALGTLASLNESLNRAGMAGEVHDARLCRARSGTDHASPAQLRYYRARLGCPVARALTAPPSSSGWPDESETNVDPAVLASSRAGLTMTGGARSTHASDVASWMRAVWPYPVRDEYAEFERTLLLAQFGGPVTTEGFDVGTSTTQGSARTVTAVLSAMQLSASHLTLTNREVASASLRRYLDQLAARTDDSSANMFEAAALRVGADVFDVPLYDDRARALADKLRVGDGVAALSADTEAPSMLASSLAAFVTGDPLSLDVLRGGGLCSSEGCQEEPAETGTPVAATVVSTAEAFMCLSPGCGGVVPFYLG